MKIKIKKPTIYFLKSLPLISAFMLAAACAVTVLFIYRNIYLTIAQVESVEQLERTVSRERLNVKLWDTVIDSRVQKLQEEAGNTEKNVATTTPPFIRDPFQPF